MIQKVVSENKTPFIEGRYILDGVVVIHEVLHQLKTIKRSGIIVKWIFEKVYDKVNWCFLQEALEKKNFDSKWVKWMLRAIKGGRVAMNLNGG